MSPGFIPPHGGYKQLKSYRKALIICDATLYFCARFFPHNRRQTDQMEQAARSGKQNIGEGSLASATSKQTEIHLTNVAKASLGELQEDYEDFLRANGLPTWDKDHPSARRLTELSRRADDVYETYRADIEHESAEISANSIRHLIIQAAFLLSRQIQRLEQDFLQKGGIRERMTTARLDARAASSAPVAIAAPVCPLCRSGMLRRTARTGANAGRDFWGCSAYPKCRGTRRFEEPEEGQGGHGGH